MFDIGLLVLIQMHLEQASTVETESNPQENWKNKLVSISNHDKIELYPSYLFQNWNKLYTSFKCKRKTKESYLVFNIGLLILIQMHFEQASTVKTENSNVTSLPVNFL